MKNYSPIAKINSRFIGGKINRGFLVKRCLKSSANLMLRSLRRNAITIKCLTACHKKRNSSWFHKHLAAAQDGIFHPIFAHLKS